MKFKGGAHHSPSRAQTSAMVHEKDPAPWPMSNSTPRALASRAAAETRYLLMLPRIFSSTRAVLARVVLGQY